MARSLISCGLIVAALLSALFGTLIEQPGSAQASTPVHQVVIFVQGINSKLDTEDKLDVPFLRIKVELQKKYRYLGLSDFINFSYHSNSYKEGTLTGYSYRCQDTGRSLNTTSAGLRRLIENYHSLHQSDKIVLVGPSMGGQVISRVIGNSKPDPMDDRTKAAISAIVTLDSPLYEATSTDVNALPRFGAGTGCVGVLTSTQAAIDLNTEQQDYLTDRDWINGSAVERRLENSMQWVSDHGGRIGTFGNDQDCVFNHTLAACAAIPTGGLDQSWTQIYRRGEPIGSSKMYSIPVGTLSCRTFKPGLPPDLGDCVGKSHAYLLDNPPLEILNTIGFHDQAAYQPPLVDNPSDHGGQPPMSQPLPASGGSPCTAGATPVPSSNLVVSPGSGAVGAVFAADVTIKNTGCAAFSPNVLTVAGKAPNPNDPYPDFSHLEGAAAVSIPPGGTYAYHATRAFPTAGVYNFRVSWRGSDGGWRDIPGAPGVSATTSVTVGSACAPGQVLITGALTVSPSNPNINDRVAASVTITNNTCETFAPAVLTVAGKGPGGESDYQDFAHRQGVVIPPGQSYAYEATRAFDRVGGYRFRVAWMDQANGWRDLPGALNVAATASLTIGSCQADPVVTGSLTIDPGQPTVNGLATAHATITNRGCSPFSPQLIGAGGRGPGGESEIMDFPLLPGIVIGPGESWAYSATRTFPHEGQYGAGMTFRDQNGNFHDIPGDGSAARGLSFPVGGCGPSATLTSPFVLIPGNPMV
ncbi:MAG: hypothetical protein ACR2OO_06825, partial [Thermomicrobiales bacterium]